ncbi:hypothetical protein [Desulfonatronospira sp.]|uniref:hypothetical protein n=1 Tax=Desulfonatronospira sp. TaxID=1962951 RepID=UPI0025BA4C9A|nr:hypothetical protein [Desulfonatronospira sp.]
MQQLTAKDGQSRDILAENVARLKKLFPEGFAEGRIDFEALKKLLGEHVEDRDEWYSFTWNCKSRSIRLAQAPSTGTLRPAPEEPLNWDSTGNLFIQGDNQSRGTTWKCSSSSRSPGPFPGIFLQSDDHEQRRDEQKHLHHADKLFRIQSGDQSLARP